MLDLNPDNPEQSFRKISDSYQELSDKVQSLLDKQQEPSKPEAKGSESKPSDLGKIV